MYANGSLSSPYCFAAAMLCTLFRRPEINKFSSEWLPILDVATNATIMDWAQILSNNLTTTSLGYRTKISFTSRVYPPFFLSAYVMDAIFLFPISLLWDGSGLYKIHFPFRFINKYYGNLISSHISWRFVMELCSLFIKFSTSEMPQDFPQRLKWTFSLCQGGLGKSF